MAAYIIWEVRQRTWDRSADREVTYLVDKGMADNTIDALYRLAWKTVMSENFVPSEWFPEDSRAVVKQGMDYFKVDDQNSAFPLFYGIPHPVFNVVPTFDEPTLTIKAVQIG